MALSRLSEWKYCIINSSCVFFLCKPLGVFIIDVNADSSHVYNDCRAVRKDIFLDFYTFETYIHSQVAFGIKNSLTKKSFIGRFAQQIPCVLKFLSS